MSLADWTLIYFQFCSADSRDPHPNKTHDAQLIRIFVYGLVQPADANIRERIGRSQNGKAT